MAYIKPNFSVINAINYYVKNNNIQNLILYLKIYIIFLHMSYTFHKKKSVVNDFGFYGNF